MGDQTIEPYSSTDKKYLTYNILMKPTVLQYINSSISMDLWNINGTYKMYVVIER